MSRTPVISIMIATKKTTTVVVFFVAVMMLITGVLDIAFTKAIFQFFS